MSEQTPELPDIWQFPMDYPFKVIGHARDGFTDDVVAVMQSHAPDDYQPQIASSPGSKYLSVTVTLRASSKVQIDTIYEALRVIEGVKLVM